MGEIGQTIANIMLHQQDQASLVQENKNAREHEKAMLKMKDDLQRSNAVRNQFWGMAVSFIENGGDPNLLQDLWDTMNEDEVTKAVSGGRDIFNPTIMGGLQSDQGKQANIMTEIARMAIPPMQELSAGRDISSPQREALSRNPFIDSAAPIESVSGLNRDFFNTGDLAAGVTTGATSSPFQNQEHQRHLEAIAASREKDMVDILTAQAQIEVMGAQANHYKAIDEQLRAEISPENLARMGKATEAQMKQVELALKIYEAEAKTTNDPKVRQQMLNGLLYGFKQAGWLPPTYSPEIIMQDPSKVQRLLSMVPGVREIARSRPAWQWIDPWLTNAEITLQAYDAMSSDAMFGDTDPLTSPLSED